MLSVYYILLMIVIHTCFENNTIYKVSFPGTESPILNSTHVTSNSSKDELPFKFQHSNNSNSSERTSEKTKFTYWHIIELILLISIFVVGVIGNAMLIAAIIKDCKLHNLQNYFILNLSIADLVTLTFVIPILITMYHIPWPFGSAACHYFVPLIDCIPAVSIFTLVVVSYDRYRIIRYSLPRSLSNGVGIFVIILIWVVSYVIVGLPLAFVMELKNGACYADWRGNNYMDFYFISRFIILYVLPTFAMFFFWFKVRKILTMNILQLKHAVSKDSQMKWIKHQLNIVTVFFVIFIVFFVCYLPFQLMTLFLIYCPQFNAWNIKHREIISICSIFAFVNAISNPMILYKFSTTFRTHFQKILLLIFGKFKKRNISNSLYESDFGEFKEWGKSFYERLLRRWSTAVVIMEDLDGEEPTERSRSSRRLVGANVIYKTTDDNINHEYISNKHIELTQDVVYISSV